MRRIAALLLNCSLALSQTTVPANSQNEENFVVRITVNLVQVDAVVTDSKGHPVTDLKADDFGVYVAATDTKLYCLDRATGKIKWQYFARIL